MSGFDALKTRYSLYHKMYCADLRRESFADWPFRDDCECTPEKMAEAGFVYSPGANDPDVACCFFCLLELEGWEPHDNPWHEHNKRNPECVFLCKIKKKDFPDLTVAEFMALEKERLKVFMKKAHHMKMAHLRDEMDKTIAKIESGVLLNANQIKETDQEYKR